MKRWKACQIPQRASEDDRGRILHVSLVLIALILFGITGYMITEGWDIGRAAFFTLISITTVGYGDYGLSRAGEVFTIFLLIGGIGTFTLLFSRILPVLFDRHRDLERKMYKQIMNMKDHIIVCGLGRVGRAVCTQLAENETPFVALDADEKAIIWAMGEGYLAAIGDATQDEVLEEVNVHTARAIVCAASLDGQNIVIALSARNLNPDITIVSRTEHEESVRKLKQAGADRVISPNRTSGTFIANLFANDDGMVDVSSIADASGNDELTLSEVSIDSLPTGSITAVQDVQTQLPGVMVVAIRTTDGLQLHPKPDAELMPGSVAIVAGRSETIAQIRNCIGNKIAA